MPANQNILANINKFVKEELDKENISSDAKYAIIGTVDNNGSKLMAAVKLKHTEKTNIHVSAVWEHDWDGDDTVGAKLIFVGK